MKILVKNFGPIRDGFLGPSGYMDIAKVTVFCGPQGSGKSTITKLLSSLSWLEKQMYRDNDFECDKESFVNALAWQGIDEYLRDGTEIRYIGSIIDINYANKDVRVDLKDVSCDCYVKPKISYVPAERNLSSVIDQASRVANLPDPLVDMQTEFDRAKRFFKKDYKLPSNGFGFEYDGKESWIRNGEGESSNLTRLDKASSGLQSMTPLLMVSDYLASQVSSNGVVSKLNQVGVRISEEEFKTDEKIERIQQSDRSESEKEKLIARIKGACRCFVNIVEEPEQNLYPLAQYDVVKSLLRLVTRIPENRLVISTHSPFVVNTMVMSAMAAMTYAKVKACNDDVLSAELGGKWAEDCAVPATDMALYEIDENGSVAKLDSSAGVLSDANKLNSFLCAWNDAFADLLRINIEAGAREKGRS